MPTSPAPEPPERSAGAARRLVADGLLASGLAVVALLGLAAWPGEAEFRSPDVLAIGLALAQTAPLAVRRRSSGVVLAVVVGATVGHLLLDYPPVSSAFLGALVATYSVAAHGPGRVPGAGAALVAVAFAVLAGAAVGSGAGWRTLEVVAGALAFVTAWVLGDRVRTRRAYTAALEDRARRLEREREAEARAAVLDERARMARELHDVVAHGVSVIVVQATAGRRVLAADPAAAGEALASIEATGRAALGELRTLLGALRSGDGDDGHGDGADGEGGRPRRPQPGLDALPDLVARTREAGVAIELEVSGGRRPLPSAVELSAYRIVQEALTNVLKHAPGARATVTVRYGADSVGVEVVDDGPPLPVVAPAAGEGHGLKGMRERVQLLGGDLQAGPRPDRGFAVRAVFPSRPAP